MSSVYVFGKCKSFLKSCLWGWTISTNRFEVDLEAEFWETKKVSSWVAVLPRLLVVISVYFFVFILFYFALLCFVFEKKLKVTNICIITSIKWQMCTSQLQMILLFYVWAGKWYLLTYKFELYNQSSIWSIWMDDI